MIDEFRCELGKQWRRLDDAAKQPTNQEKDKGTLLPLQSEIDNCRRRLERIHRRLTLWCENRKRADEVLDVAHEIVAASHKWFDCLEQSSLLQQTEGRRVDVVPPPEWLEAYQRLNEMAGDMRAVPDAFAIQNCSDALARSADTPRKDSTATDGMPPDDMAAKIQDVRRMRPVIKRSWQLYHHAQKELAENQSDVTNQKVWEYVNEVCDFEEVLGQEGKTYTLPKRKSTFFEYVRKFESKLGAMSAEELRCIAKEVFL